MPIATSSRLVSEIVTAVQRQFGDESGTQINSDDIIRWINQGCARIATSEDVLRTTATTTSVAGQSQYSMSGINPIKLFRVDYESSPLQNITHESAQQTILEMPEVANISGTPTTWYEWGDSIFLYPTPSKSGASIKLYLTTLPTKVTTTTDVIPIPDVYYEALLQYALQQAYELDESFDMAAVKGNQMRDRLSEVDPEASNRFYKTITIAPEDA